MINSHGVQEVNPMPKGYHDEELKYIDWEELKETKDVVAERVRFISSPGFPYWDSSYFHVRINGKKYEVLNHPFERVLKKNFKSNLYNLLKKENVFIKNFFERISTLN